jgi:hypothetical protein
MNMMDQPTDRLKKLIKLLKRLLKQEHLYTDEKLSEMKSQLKILEEQFLELKTQTSKGFGKK